jgi:hypothetical protein
LWQTFGTNSLAYRLPAAARQLIARFDRVIGDTPPGVRLLDIGRGNGHSPAIPRNYAAAGPGVGADTNQAAIIRAIFSSLGNWVWLSRSNM